MKNPISKCLDPIRLFWDLVNQHGWNSKKVYEEHRRIQAQRWAPIFGHAERLMRTGRNPISYVDRNRSTCSECKSVIDERVCSLLFGQRKLLLCEKCWRFLYPVEEKKRSTRPKRSIHPPSITIR